MKYKHRTEKGEYYLFMLIRIIKVNFLQSLDR